MNTDALLYEVQGQEKELKRLKGRVKTCNERIKDLMSQVYENMRQAGEEDHVYNGQTYHIEEKTVKTRKGDTKKRQDVLTVLNDEGIEGPDAEEIYEKVLGAMHGPETVRHRVVKLK